jgi:hypothetical protein
MRDLTVGEAVKAMVLNGRSCMANVRQIRIGAKHGMISPSTI